MTRTAYRAICYFDTVGMRRWRGKLSGVRPSILRAARYRAKPMKWVPMLAYEHRRDTERYSY